MVISFARRALVRVTTAATTPQIDATPERGLESVAKVLAEDLAEVLAEVLAEFAVEMAAEGVEQSVRCMSAFG